MYLYFLYIDDFLIFKNNGDESIDVKNLLKEKFRMTDMNSNVPVSSFLGIKITLNTEAKEVTLSQKKYNLLVSEKYRMSDCNSVKTSMEQNLKIERSCDPSKISQFQEMPTVPYLCTPDVS